MADLGALQQLVDQYEREVQEAGERFRKGLLALKDERPKAEYLSVKEAALRYRVAARRVREAIEGKRLPARVGPRGVLLVSDKDVERWLGNQEYQPRSERAPQPRDALEAMLERGELEL